MALLIDLSRAGDSQTDVIIKKKIYCSFIKKIFIIFTKKNYKCPKSQAINIKMY